MSSVSVHIEPDPMRLATSMMDVARGLENTLIPMAEAGEVLQADIHKRFETETDPSGTPWQRLSINYILSGWRDPPYTSRRPTGTTLKDTGQLETDATSNRAILIRHDTLFYQLGALPSYGIAHETGLPEREHPLPKRSFLGLSDEAEAVIIANFAEWFEGVLNLYPTSTGKLGPKHAFRAKPGGFFLPRSAL